MEPVVSQTKALFCTIISVMGVVFLFIMGLLFSADVEELVEGPEPIENPGKVARACYLAGFLYLLLVLFCGFQVKLHQQ